MAAGLLWILDASINVSMEPFRAFVADKLNDEQRTTRLRDAELLHRAGRHVASARRRCSLPVSGVTAATRERYPADR